ncbi:MBOAT family protein [Myxococcaceae bacterium GXIMD 01537]
MLFTSPTFLLFHVLVVALRWVLPARWVGPLLLVSSYVFYLSWGPIYGLLIGGMTVAAWGVALGLERWGSRKLPLGASVTALLAVLAGFKYVGFLAAQAGAVLQWLGHTGGPSRFDVVLPLAISFYTFELISYLVDVYRGEPAERSLWRFTLYVAYYPHLIAGPIVRASELLPQLRTPPAFDGKLFSDGVFLMLVGFVKKLVFADRFSLWADEVFAHPEAHASFGVWVGVLAYTGQIYCDFSGYTDIARGASRMLGLELPENFSLPYLSTSITEFWRRWHMTLSRWLRDYLYISLGGNRLGALLQYRNLFLTMLLGGLWHGANWTFVAWGALHGGGLAAHKLWDGLARRSSWGRVREAVPYRVLAWAVTFVFVMVGWVYFRAPSFHLAHTVLGRMFIPSPGPDTLAVGLARLPVGLSTSLALAAALAVGQVLGRFQVPVRLHGWMPAPARGLVWLALVLGCFLLAEPREQFIYFQF